MIERTKKFLFDILFSIELIESFTKDINTYSDYCGDAKTQSAVERQLAIIGEALHHIHKTDPEVAIENAKQIIGLRNRLIHAYDKIDNTIIWTILQKHVKPLKEEVNILLT